MPIKPVDGESTNVNYTPNLNIETEAKRILHVMDQILARAELAGLLPTLIEDKGRRLRTLMDPATIALILQSCEKYATTLFGKTKTSDSEVGSSTKSSDSEVEKVAGDARDNVMSNPSIGAGSEDSEAQDNDRNDKALSKIIYILEDNSEIPIWAAENNIKMSRPMANFLKSLTDFRNLMEVFLKETVDQYKARESFMRDTYEQNEKAKREILELEDELIVTETGTNVCLIGRNVLINRHQNKIDKIKRQCMEAIDKRVKESEKAMVNDWKNSMEQQENLKESLDENTARYNALVEEDLENEKLLRTKRTKLENQILGWIQKFDADMGEKQAEEEKLQALLDEETNLVNEIQQKLEEQEEEYDELMQEKAEYEEEKLEQTLHQFLLNRSVRRIQRHYRLYKAKKMAKKLAKKGKKGKKAKKEKNEKNEKKEKKEKKEKNK